jgi:hypothetical protein
MINNNITKEKLVKELSIYRDYHFPHREYIKREVFNMVIYLINTTKDETVKK